MNKSTEFLSAIDAIRKKPIPPEVMARARRSLLDYLAVTCAGAAFQKDKLQRYYLFAEPEAGAFRAIGTGKDLALKEAVFLNGLNAHALDMDDGTNSGIIHLGSPIFSLLIPLAQRGGIKTEDMLSAAVIGYEASYTMAVSIQPVHKAMGYHATGTCGTLGASVAASCMLGFSEEERRRAFASACAAAGGMLKVLDDGSELKPYNVAKAGLLALTAVQIAKAGFRGGSDPLGGRGFLKMMTGREDVDIKPVLLNGSYAIMKSYTKPYASCRYTHPAVEAAIRLREKLSPESVRRIEVRTYSLAVPGHDHTEIANSASAKMSIPYATAAGLLYGRAGLGEFIADRIREKEVMELTKKVRVIPDKDLSERFPDTQTAIVSIETNNGVYSEQVDFPKGEPENPLTDAEFKSRFLDLMEYADVERSACTELFDRVLDGKSTVGELVGIL